MCKFAIKLLLIIVTSFVVANVLSFLILASEILTSVFVTKKFGNETYQALKKSKITTTANTIIIGDSVARHIFSAENADQLEYYNLSSNVWGSLIGQYIIATNVFQANKKIKKIYLFFHPDSFQNDLDQPWTYSYVVKPFFTYEYRDKFTDNAIRKLKSKNLYFLYKLPIAKTLPVFNKIDYSDSKEWTGFPNVQQKPYFSEIAIEYLHKLKKLCTENKAKLNVVMPPISKKYNTDFSTMKAQIKDNQLDDIFCEYFANVYVLDDAYFKDGIHVKKEHLNDIYAIVHKQLQMQNCN
jgi:hypothetical protein